MDRPSVTRSELLARRAQVALAREGRNLLDEKRRALAAELERSVGAVLAGEETLERAAAVARRALACAEALDGPEAVRSAALATAGDVPVDARTTTIMGVTLPAIAHRRVGRPRTARGPSLEGTSARLDVAAERFEEEVEHVLDLAASELRVRRIASEIGRTTRRINALERILIPRLEAERDAIRLALAEREREDRFRLTRLLSRRPP
jgi:V/A-type H+-transporting ATPase subunit D